MRSLLLIPMIHNAADLGSLAESVKSHYVRKLGRAGWRDRERAVARVWNEIRNGIGALDLDYQRVRIYQDGLPICGYELQLVQELARAGSLNHQLVLDLVQKGATLMGTEDPQLLIQEYRMHQRQLVAAKAGGRPSPADAGEAARLLEARDQFIARRISETLLDKERGLVFLGAAHRLAAMESCDIQFQTLD
ncbi:MAG: hypothetical protein ACYC35_23485 [Pirellulales bacterium]